MTKEIEALETLDDYSDEEYSAYLEYTSLKDGCIIDPTTLYINKNQPAVAGQIEPSALEVYHKY